MYTSFALAWQGPAQVTYEQQMLLIYRWVSCKLHVPAHAAQLGYSVPMLHSARSLQDSSGLCRLFSHC